MSVVTYLVELDSGLPSRGAFRGGDALASGLLGERLLEKLEVRAGEVHVARASWCDVSGHWCGRNASFPITIPVHGCGLYKRLYMDWSGGGVKKHLELTIEKEGEAAILIF